MRATLNSSHCKPTVRVAAPTIPCSIGRVEAGWLQASLHGPYKDCDEHCSEAHGEPYCRWMQSWTHQLGWNGLQPALVSHQLANPMGLMGLIPSPDTGLVKAQKSAGLGTAFETMMARPDLYLHRPRGWSIAVGLAQPWLRGLWQVSFHSRWPAEFDTHHDVLLYHFHTCKSSPSGCHSLIRRGQPDASRRAVGWLRRQPQPHQKPFSPEAAKVQLPFGDTRSSII